MRDGGEAENAAIAFLLQLDPATQREVLERFEEALEVETDNESRRRRRVTQALHEAKRTLGKSPSVREYKALRRAHPERGWPDPRSITRWLGVRSWNDALVRMRLEAVVTGDVIEGAIGPMYSVDEGIQAVRDCAEDLGRPPTITDYLAWQRRPDVRDRPGRRPASTWVFNRIFGGFAAARVAAGLVEGEPTAAHPSDLLLRTSNYRLGDDQIAEDIRFAASRIAGPLTATAYDRERRLVYLETRAAGHPRALAGVGTIYRHFRTWTAGLEAAGIDTQAHTTIATRARRTRRFSNEGILRALSEAYDAVDGRLTLEGFTAWREQESQRDSTKRAALPSYITIRRRFGGWAKAVEQMHEWRTTA
jgi:hypothetical protein